ncbi:oxygenase MpaB family protein [Nocardia sp. CA-136227]|uniref:oxygenase MpaB family protein n=1 Tax=Nocardia sp. CA-136227 TaxID=3239979 RepID=UPI003D991BCE
MAGKFRKLSDLMTTRGQAGSARTKPVAWLTAPVQPAEDYGFFGPGSVTWKVWGYPTSMSVGFQRAVVIEELDPFLVASVATTGKVYSQARIRYDRTLAYFATVLFGDTKTATTASAVLMRIHAENGVGTEPVSGLYYDANDPESQLWIHLTAWHSILYVYETFGPGRLSEDEERQFWHECAVAAELQTCDPALVPRTREGVRAYFEEVRTRLVASEVTQRMMNHLLNAEVMYPPMLGRMRPVGWVANQFLRRATIATLPGWQRELAGVRQSKAADTAVRLLAKPVFRVVSHSARIQLALLSWLSPSTAPVVAPFFRGIPPVRPETLSPADAYARWEVPTPAEMYAKVHPDFKLTPYPA